ncbi:hypothetical protein AB1Y20_005760 [Prymnesium parvum]|uniref:Protein of centriole 5 n=1 Tax=Prymnesium parvum TaxID=97485 RepID=A0AB34J0I5_PRYPA
MADLLLQRIAEFEAKLREAKPRASSLGTALSAADSDDDEPLSTPLTIPAHHAAADEARSMRWQRESYEAEALTRRVREAEAQAAAAQRALREAEAAHERALERAVAAAEAQQQRLLDESTAREARIRAHHAEAEGMLRAQLARAAGGVAAAQAQAEERRRAAAQIVARASRAVRAVSRAAADINLTLEERQKLSVALEAAHSEVRAAKEREAEVQAEALSATATAEVAASELRRWRASAERAHAAIRQGATVAETHTEVLLHELRAAEAEWRDRLRAERVARAAAEAEARGAAARAEHAERAAAAEAWHAAALERQLAAAEGAAREAEAEARARMSAAVGRDAAGIAAAARELQIAEVRALREVADAHSRRADEMSAALLKAREAAESAARTAHHLSASVREGERLLARREEEVAREAAAAAERLQLLQEVLEQERRESAALSSSFSVVALERQKAEERLLHLSETYEEEERQRAAVHEEESRVRNAIEAALAASIGDLEREAACARGQREEARWQCELMEERHQQTVIALEQQIDDQKVFSSKHQQLLLQYADRLGRQAEELSISFIRQQDAMLWTLVASHIGHLRRVSVRTAIRVSSAGIRRASAKFTIERLRRSYSSWLQSHALQLRLAYEKSQRRDEFGAERSFRLRRCRMAIDAWSENARAAMMLAARKHRLHLMTMAARHTLRRWTRWSRARASTRRSSRSLRRRCLRRGLSRWLLAAMYSALTRQCCQPIVRNLTSTRADRRRLGVYLSHWQRQVARDESQRQALMLLQVLGALRASEAAVHCLTEEVLLVEGDWRDAFCALSAKKQKPKPPTPLPHYAQPLGRTAAERLERKNSQALPRTPTELVRRNSLPPDSPAHYLTELVAMTAEEEVGVEPEGQVMGEAATEEVTMLLKMGQKAGMVEEELINDQERHIAIMHKI